MGDPVRLRVYGTPMPQGSKTPYRNQHTGRIHMVDGRSKAAVKAFHSWRDGITEAARGWQADNDEALIDEPVAITVVFLLDKPASKPKWRWLPDTRPDVDKLARAVLDGLGGVLIRSDAQVVALGAAKRYVVDEAPGCEIVVTPVAEEERSRRAVSASVVIVPPTAAAKPGPVGEQLAL